jgi:hypothetical protein
MRTVEDRERLEPLPQVHDALYQLRPAANFVFQVYQQIGEFEAKAPDAAAESWPPAEWSGCSVSCLGCLPQR